MPLAVFSALRLGLFIAALLLLRGAGMRGWLLVVVAAVVAWAVSYVVLGRQRDAAALWLADRAARRDASGVRFSRRIDEDAAVEDAESDALGRRRPDEVRRPDTPGRATDVDRPVPEPGPDGDGPQSDRPRPSSTP